MNQYMSTIRYPKPKTFKSHFNPTKKIQRITWNEPEKKMQIREKCENSKGQSLVGRHSELIIENTRLLYAIIVVL